MRDLISRQAAIDTHYDILIHRYMKRHSPSKSMMDFQKKYYAPMLAYMVLRIMGIIKGAIND